MTDTNDKREAIAQAMHDAYEVAAAEAGWETNPRSRVAWEDVPAENKAAMLAAVDAVLPFVEQAEQRGYERGKAHRLDELVKSNQKGRREALTDARNAIEAHRTPIAVELGGDLDHLHDEDGALSLNEVVNYVAERMLAAFDWLEATDGSA